MSCELGSFIKQTVSISSVSTVRMCFLYERKVNFVASLTMSLTKQGRRYLGLWDREFFRIFSYLKSKILKFSSRHIQKYIKNSAMTNILFNMVLTSKTLKDAGSTASLSALLRNSGSPHHRPLAPPTTAAAATVTGNTGETETVSER